MQQGPLAQLAEQLTFNPQVQGSRPWRPTILGLVETLLWLFDEVLDWVPKHEDGRWYWPGYWGCDLAYRYPVLRWWGTGASSSAG